MDKARTIGKTRIETDEKSQSSKHLARGINSTSGDYEQQMPDMAHDVMGQVTAEVHDLVRAIQKRLSQEDWSCSLGQTGRRLCRMSGIRTSGK